MYPSYTGAINNRNVSATNILIYAEFPNCGDYEYTFLDPSDPRLDPTDPSYDPLLDILVPDTTTFVAKSCYCEYYNTGQMLITRNGT